MLYVANQIWSDTLNVVEMMNVLLILYIGLVSLLVFMMRRWEEAMRMRATAHERPLVDNAAFPVLLPPAARLSRRLEERATLCPAGGPAGRAHHAGPRRALPLGRRRGAQALASGQESVLATILKWTPLITGLRAQCRHLLIAMGLGTMLGCSSASRRSRSCRRCARGPGR